MQPQQAYQQLSLVGGSEPSSPKKQQQQQSLETDEAAVISLLANQLSQQQQQTHGLNQTATTAAQATSMLPRTPKDVTLTPVTEEDYQVGVVGVGGK